MSQAPAAPRKSAAKSGRSRAREFALQALYQHLVGRNETTAIDAFTRDLSGFNKADAAHYDALLHGCVAEAEALDAADPLAPLRGLFHIPDGLVYLDGNSLGVLPAATAARVAQVVAQEWGEGLIGSWNAAGWMALPQRIGDKIAPLLGVGPGEVVVADSTSVNLFKVLSAGG